MEEVLKPDLCVIGGGSGGLSVAAVAVPRSAGRRVRFPGMSIFELEGGRIAAYREYFDEGLALLQLGFAPESLAKVLRRRLG